jgi:hypothetical protein
LPKLRVKWAEAHPARAALEELIDSKSAALKQDAEIREKIARFDELASTSVDAVQAELNALDAEERGAWDTWVRGNPSKPAPIADADKRADINRRLAEARAKADAAERGATELRSQLNAHASTIAQADREIASAIPGVLLDEFQGPLIEDVRAAGAAMMVAIAKLNRFRDFVWSSVNSMPRDAAGDSYRRLEGLDVAIRDVHRKPDESAVNDAAFGAWARLAHELRSNAKAQLEDVSLDAEPFELSQDRIDEIMRKREQALRAA